MHRVNCTHVKLRDLIVGKFAKILLCMSYIILKNYRHGEMTQGKCTQELSVNKRVFFMKDETNLRPTAFAYSLKTDRHQQRSDQSAPHAGGRKNKIHISSQDGSQPVVQTCICSYSQVFPGSINRVNLI